ncbi:hypothetical protein EVAR_22154_1 [Eumeta japonica]|uniref:Uncharacterized protein n=1 Tax=Eumeta variegata TaxID=151549 RepID=A0A4C1W090_EUMVA|nr:hypothetical protein EVAR_22154_1 [Eumeta japonica]
MRNATERYKKNVLARIVCQSQFKRGKQRRVTGRQLSRECESTRAVRPMFVCVFALGTPACSRGDRARALRLLEGEANIQDVSIYNSFSPKPTSKASAGVAPRGVGRRRLSRPTAGPGAPFSLVSRRTH